MKKTWTSLFALALLILHGLALAQKPEPQLLKIATGELPPYATESRADKGIALSIVRRAFELEGYRVEFTFLPWSRALAESRAGKWDGTAYWGHKPEHDASFFLSDNVITEQWVFVYRNALDFKWQQLTDLRPYRIAMIQDYTYTPEIWAMANKAELKVEKLPNDMAALRLLLLKRVDVAPMERNVTCDLLARNFSPGDAAQLSAHPKLMTDSFTTHLMMSRGLPSSAGRVAAFNAGLKKLRASGEYQKLSSQVNCPQGWSDVAKTAH
ncbi:substrate-binding periplasmic protein [Undibacterium pigrum]|uniref:Amino acid ABC transporter substrate-binding protein (PAAT family) n=1 Tax=Undibacterium pigrum TaxID=401470 RepID=A0A318IKI8_9BURK|nr:ABC transporter substrate-binding protein [Undibacterium pigrum]PXX35353.1 amino acid ABC transporter substrate-binding protein (PAAT family) [Undibacterium pigrum]